MILKEDCKKLLLRLELLRNFYWSSKEDGLLYRIFYREKIQKEVSLCGKYTGN